MSIAAWNHVCYQESSICWRMCGVTIRYDAPLAQLVERQSHNLKVASSSLAGSTSLLFVSLPLSLAFCRSHTLLTIAMRHLYKMVCINSITI